MKTKLIINFVPFSCLIFVGSLYASGEPNKPVLIWGQEVNCLQAAVEFIPEKEAYKQGEIIGIVFHVRNVSDSQIQFVTSDWRNEDKCIIKDPKGNEIQCNSNMYLGWVDTNRIFLDPCESALLRSASFGISQNTSQGFSHPVGHYAYLKPGRYLLCYQLRFPDIRSSDLPDEPNDWMGTLETGKRELFVSVGRQEPNSPGKK